MQKATILLCISFFALASPMSIGRNTSSNPSQSLGQWLQLWDEKYTSGTRFELWADDNDFGNLYSNIAESGYFWGTWVLFDRTYFDSSVSNFYSTALYCYKKFCWSTKLTLVHNLQDGSFYGYGDGIYIHDFGIFSNRASSARYIGDQYNYKADTINLYTQDGFGGTEETWHDSYPDIALDNQVRSIITTGCAYWTVYSEDFYVGDKICFHPRSDCSPAFWFGDQLGSLYKRVSSVWKASSCPAGVKEVKADRIMKPGEFEIYTNSDWSHHIIN